MIISVKLFIQLQTYMCMFNQGQFLPIQSSEHHHFFGAKFRALSSLFAHLALETLAHPYPQISPLAKVSHIAIVLGIGRFAILLLSTFSCYCNSFFQHACAYTKIALGNHSNKKIVKMLKLCHSNQKATENML